MEDKKLFWKSLGSEHALDTRWLKVKKETVELPNGKILDDFYTVEGGELIAILAVDRDSNVFLVKQYRHAVGDVTIDLPGGGVEKGEQPIDAARRELAEETGMLANHMEKLLTYYPDSGRTTCTKHIFLATELKEDTGNSYSQDESENIRLIRMSLEELLEKMKSGEMKEATLHVGVSSYLSRSEFGKE
ncbi:MAG: NUDIX hydrolase [Candidatus Moraniibacteriota bacterium]